MVDGREQPLVPGHAPTLHIGPVNGQGQIDGIYGNGGCNDYDGTYTLSGDTIHLSMRGYTQMFCDATDEENAYFRVLGGIKRYHVEGNTLTLTSADGSVQLTFRAI
jgi:heat shock protein HslJ